MVKTMRRALVGVAILVAVLLPERARALPPPVTLGLVDPVSGAPGTPQGWGFTLTNNMAAGNFVVVTSVSASPSLTALGTFTDFAAQFQYVVVAGGGNAVQTFNNATQTGAGSLLSAIPNATATGTITMTYDVYSVDPTSVGFNPLTDGVSFGNTVQGAATFGTTPVTLTGFEIE